MQGTAICPAQAYNSQGAIPPRHTVLLLNAASVSHIQWEVVEATMKVLSFTISTILFWGALAFGQEAPAKTQLFSSDLIAWSAMQKPQEPEKQPAHQQPTPDPNPETQPTQNSTPSQPSSPSSRQEQSQSQSQAPAAQIFTGTVSKDAGNFVLKVSETTFYKLDNQQQVQQYEGQRVRVTGTLDQAMNLIHVDRIEPLS